MIFKMTLANLLMLSITFMGCHGNPPWDRYTKDPGLADLMCPSDQVGFQQTVWNVLWCVRQCAAQPACRSLIYLQGNKTCYGLISDDPFGASSALLPGTMFYRSNKAPITPTAMTGPGTPVVTGLADIQFTASGVFNASHEAWHGKLDNPTTCWIPDAQNTQQWIQVEFLDTILASHVVTKGYPGGVYYVKTYTVQTNTDCGATYVTVQYENGTDKVFEGNDDGDTAVQNALAPPVVCRCLRLRPMSAMTYIALRFDVLVHTITQGTALAATLSDDKFTASSSCSASYEPWYAKINNTEFCWGPNTQDQQQWIQVDFSAKILATHVETKGHPNIALDKWVAQYKVLTSTDCTTGSFVVVQELGSDKLFDGNVDSDTAVRNTLRPPVVCRCLRINPWTGYGFIALRFEVLVHLI